MPIQTLDHYNLRAPLGVIEAVRDFYVQVLGLQIGSRPAFKSQGYWLYAAARPLLHLSIATADQIRPSHVTNTLDHIAFACTDYAHFMAKLQQHQIPYECDTVPGTTMRQIFLSDPAGNGVELNFVD